MATQINLEFDTNMDRSSLTPTGNVTVKSTPWDNYTESFDYDSQEAEDVPVQIQLVGDSKTVFLAVFTGDLNPELQYRFTFTDSVEDELNVPITPFNKFFGLGTIAGG